MRSERLIPVLLLVSGLLFFGQTLFYGFVSDDFYLVHRVADEGFYSEWGGQTNTSFYRPVVVLSYVVDHWIWGSRAPGFHLTNVLWHLLCSVLVFVLAGELLKNRIQALAAGALFLFLACHSESVAWVSGRTDLIATAFALASVIYFLRGSVISLPLFVTALLAKESVIITPVIYLLLAVSLKQVRKSWPLLAGSAVVSVLYLAGRFLLSPGFASRSGFSFHLRELPENLLRYFFRVFIPPLPGTLRPFLTEHLWIIPVAVFSAAVLILFSIRKSREKGLTTILAVCFLTALLPVLLMKVSLFDSRSERFLYLPGVFAVIMLIRWLGTVLEQRRALVLIVLLTAVQITGLQLSMLNWKHAGEMCFRITEQLAELDPDSVVLVNVPEGFNGAYVFRNGLNEAVSMHTGREVQFRTVASAGDTTGTVDVSALPIIP